jgi:tRNA dimethylallyltransferase
MKPPVLVLAGPTASGKTDLAIRMALELGVEPVNADGLQVFRKLDIGTAKPSKEELGNVPYHLLDVLDPDQPVTAGWYAREARRVIAEIHLRGRLPLLVGGSGFYLKALEHPPIAEPLPEKEIDPAEAHLRLSKADPEAARRIHPNDRYRLNRAIAILDRGDLPSELWKRAEAQESAYDFKWIGLRWERPELIDRINKRVAEMYRRGLVNETRSVLEAHPSARPRLERTIGYREALGVLKLDFGVEEAVERTGIATRQYAKRQMTWFKKESRIEWLPYAEAFDRVGSVMKKIAWIPE